MHQSRTLTRKRPASLGCSKLQKIDSQAGKQSNATNPPTTNHHDVANRIDGLLPSANPDICHRHPPATMTSTIGIPIKLLNEAQVRDNSLPPSLLQRSSPSTPPAQPSAARSTQPS